MTSGSTKTDYRFVIRRYRWNGRYVWIVKLCWWEHGRYVETFTNRLAGMFPTWEMAMRDVLKQLRT